jgi:hypothetical protein
MAEFYKGFVFERDVSAQLTIEGNPVRVERGPRVTVKLPSGETINAASVSAVARLYIIRSGDLADRNRLAKKHLQELLKGRAAWNGWRREHPDIKPVLANKNLSVKFKERTLAGYDFSYTNLCQARMQGLDLRRANFHQAILAKANLSGAHLEGANFCRTDLYETNFKNAFLARANLQGVQMVRTNLVGADLRGCKVYGLSAWDLKLDEPAVKQQLIVRYRPSYARRPNQDDEVVEVEGLDLAAFMYLTLNNRNISRIIEAAARKWVLLLGRFTHRKSVLKAIAEWLKQRQLTPIIFDFPPPKKRDLVETVMLLAGMSALVIVEITNPRSTPMELQAIVSNYGVPVVPLMKKGAKEFGTFSALRKFPWVHPTITYDTTEELIARLQKNVIGPLTSGPA